LSKKPLLQNLQKKIQSIFVSHVLSFVGNLGTADIGKCIVAITLIDISIFRW
jgi:hypothetical protein